MFNDIICDHFMNPRNIGELPDADCVIEISNPICGDTVHMYLKLNNDIITNVAYRAYGCSTSIATASIVSERITDMPKDKIPSITRDEVEEWLGELEPSQLHCVDIALNILSQCANPTKKKFEQKEFLVEGEGAF